MTAPAQLPLLNAPIVGVEQVDVDDVNRLLVEWKHRLGACTRSFRQDGFVLFLDGRPIGCAMSASIVSTHLSDAEGHRLYDRTEVVELARLCAAPGNRWANRVLLRIWREVLAPRWCWPVRAAVSYSHNAMHRGDLYRADGWEKIRANCGSGGGGSHSASRRVGTDAVAGAKTLWLWRYPTTHVPLFAEVAE